MKVFFCLLYDGLLSLWSYDGAAFQVIVMLVEARAGDI